MSPMPQRPRVSLISVALLGVALLGYQPARQTALAVLRFPLTAANALTSILVTLPRLPSLTRENAALRAES